MSFAWTAQPNRGRSWLSGCNAQDVLSDWMERTGTQRATSRLCLMNWLIGRRLQWVVSSNEYVPLSTR